MQNDILLIIVGVVAGFIGATVIRLIKNNLERKRLTQEQYEDENPSQKKIISELLSDKKNEANYWPAWLKLVETPTPSIFEGILEKTWVQENVTFKPWVDKDSISPDFQKTISLKESFSRNIYENRKEFSKTIRTFNLARTQILGRDKDCEIVLSEINVSRLHALIRFETGNYVIYDISSTSGIYLNNVRVSRQGVILKPNDLIIMGLSVLIFEGNTPDSSHKSVGDKT